MRQNPSNGCLLLRFRDFVQEVREVRSFAKHLLTDESLTVLQDFESNIEGFAANKKLSRGTLEIDRQRPIKTAISEGRYQPDAEGGRRLFGTLSGVWEIERLPGKDWGLFRTIGLSSWVASLHPEEEPDFPLARWSFDLGTRGAPGCFLHVQFDTPDYLAMETDSRLDVPRLPSLLITPMDALVFMLGELFQDAWPATGGALFERSVSTFRNVQLVRMHKTLSWYQRELESTVGIPWDGLKRALPHDLKMHDGR